MDSEEDQQFRDWLDQQRADAQEQRGLNQLPKADPATIVRELEALAKSNAAAISTVGGGVRRFGVSWRGARLWISAGAHELSVEPLPETGELKLTGYQYPLTRIGEGDPDRASELDERINVVPLAQPRRGLFQDESCSV